jgi:hypothetical protein
MKLLKNYRRVLVDFGINTCEKCCFKGKGEKCNFFDTFGNIDRFCGGRKYFKEIGGVKVLLKELLS